MRRWFRSNEHDAPRAGSAEPPLPGVIDTVGLGYASLITRPEVVLPPVVLDLYLWFGLRMTARPFTAEVASWLWDEGEAAAALARDVDGWRSFNVFELLSMRLPTLRMPGMVPLLGDGQPSFARTWVVTDAAWWVVLGVGLAALLAGLLIGSGYLVALAATATGAGRIADAVRPRVMLDVGGRIALWLLAMTAVLTLVSMPLLLLAGVGVWRGESGLTPVLGFTIFPIAWGFVYFYFSVQALVVDRLGPFAAMRASYLVVKRYFRQSMTFILISLTITTGFPFALRALTDQPAGLVLAIIAHAFIASGMLVAGMLFYRDRARRIGLPAFVSER